MSRIVFRLPDVGEGTAEAELVALHVAVGDQVEEDQTLAEVMTDKATVEIPSPASGRVVSITGVPGQKLAVGAEFVVLEVEGAATTDTAPPATTDPLPPGLTGRSTVPEHDPGGPVDLRLKPADDEVRRPSAPGDRPLASPAVRRRAVELGIELRAVTGTGPGGRITHEDLAAFTASGGPPRPSAKRQGVEEIKVIGLRRVIAERMQNAKRRIPHFSYIEEVDVTALEEARGQLNGAWSKARGRLTLLPFLVRALVRVLPDYPQVNARFDDEAGVVQRFAGIHVGVATQTPSGLVVPVLRHAEALTLWEAAAEIARLAEAARAGKAAAAELSGSTISITSLGALGGLATTPVINYPEVAIIGVNKMIERPVVREGRIVIRKMMNLSASFDHRVVDGWDAAEFIQRVRALLEQPALLLVE